MILIGRSLILIAAQKQVYVYSGLLELKYGIGAAGKRARYIFIRRGCIYPYGGRARARSRLHKVEAAPRALIAYLCGLPRS